jgi:large subunit ribosomal protein L32
MPVPKRKRSRARRDKRFANKGLKVKAIMACMNCKEAILPHQACRACGHYKGIKVLKTKTDRAMKRGQTRQAHIKAAEARQKAEPKA